MLEVGFFVASSLTVGICLYDWGLVVAMEYSAIVGTLAGAFICLGGGCLCG